MYRRLKIAIPAFQVAMAVLVFSLSRLHITNIYQEVYLHRAREILIGINFPVVVVSIVVFAPIKWIVEYLSEINRTVALVAQALVLGMVLIGVALFWYLLVKEVELRRRQQSMLRSANSTKQHLVTVMLVVCGLGSALYGYVTSRPLLYDPPMDAVLNGGFPILWGGLSIGIAIYDVACARKGKALDSGSGND